MSQSEIYIGQMLKQPHESNVAGGYVTINNETFYKIANYDQMPAFFMSIVSDCDHWLFISSLGGLTAGRENADNALFPYGTDDKITDSSDFTGSKTLILASKQNKRSLWEPFSHRYTGVYTCERNLYKNVYGDKLIFEEVNHDLNLAFRYSWMTSDKFGFIKTSEIFNLGNDDTIINILDGIENILPYGVSKNLQQEYSCLVDAYKKNELESATGLGIYSMSSILVDRAEPSEALSATCVWSHGLANSTKLLSSRQLNDFRQGKKLSQETDIRGTRGAYFVNSEFNLVKHGNQSWHIVADINQGPAAVKNLMAYIQADKNIDNDIQQDIQLGCENLARIVGNADGLQVTADTLSSNHHFSNVLFNVMRGGLFDNNYAIEKTDLIAFINTINSDTFKNSSAFLNDLPESMHYSTLISAAEKTGNQNLIRACYEYLPLTFSRRHGDPSRPWNKFSISLKNNDGSKRLNYEGNWRDIFQNWEALSFSIPNFVEGMISKFVNASTADGYNPYRITKKGIDWEELNPEDPWSNIGYWGDHQIIYLLKLLEFSKNYHPGTLDKLLAQDIFCYANVPYSIKAYEDLLANPHDTINYDNERQQRIDARVAKVGADGKILWLNNEVYHVNLTEKILASMLAKLSNFIPEGGIWMNTQRPEWNDANNALVGYGISMVTLYYLRRLQNYLLDLLSHSQNTEFLLSIEIAQLLEDIHQVFDNNQQQLTHKLNDEQRKHIVDLLGKAGENYRNKIYRHEFSGDRIAVSAKKLIAFTQLSLTFIDHTIAANKRNDGLYHAYNLMTAHKDGIQIDTLDEMLEGQVAVLSSGYLKPQEAIELLSHLRQSKLYTARQHSYLLYPDRQLKRFVDKNTIPADLAKKSQLIHTLCVDGDRTLVEIDAQGEIHFNGRFNNVESLKKALNTLSPSKYQHLIEQEGSLICDMFEQVFNHKAFTGRSGGMYAYQGLGSIYWHMVSKLLLAALENHQNAIKQGEDDSVIPKLAELYCDIRSGIGFNKTPENYGAFPTDPYSHTPGFAGAKQPGMTGQVKEEVITRQFELGVVVEAGQIHFKPTLLRQSEFLSAPAELTYIDVKNNKQKLSLTSNQLGFTFCQVPIVYSHVDDTTIKIMLTMKNGSTILMDTHVIDVVNSSAIFAKNGDIKHIHVYLHTKFN